MITNKDRYIACMVLHGVGDSVGYNNGYWEFCTSYKVIKNELDKLGGINKLQFKTMLVSDDTIFHIANAKYLVDYINKKSEILYCELIKYYKSAMTDMKDRAPGKTLIMSVKELDFKKEDGYKIKFNPRGGGCGVSMRSSCIGLRYPKPEQLNDLIKFSIESGRMTHNSPIGYLGGFSVALFISYAIQGKNIFNWGYNMVKALEDAKKYIIETGRDVEENLNQWNEYVERWIEYLNKREINNPDSTKATFPDPYDYEEREKSYNEISHGRWPGSLGHDSVIIAYDALLGCNGDWIELCHRSMIHGGDSDSTGCIAGSFYGAFYGFEGVQMENIKDLEYKHLLESLGEELYNINFSDNH